MLREGDRQRIPVDHLVVGDVVVVNVGDRVPADIRIISSSGFKVREREREREREKDMGGINGLTD